jgi:hypothetical protein
MTLDQIYKSQLPTSHEAGLQAVFQAGQESVFLPSTPDSDPTPTPEATE